ncbi:hypothetical protein [Calothrix sp. PCC 6303]|uniref:hypothetical protein n=1 Tax=Calothrix sp. PCC 6303 TaxID=1170562 RepID=UPI001EF0F58F|nr:hypothetical protein [Calothrix sp. PCC 6303]
MPIIPNWEDTKFIFSLIVFLLNFVIGFLLFIKPKKIQIKKARILILLNLLLSSVVFLFALFIILISSGFDAPSIQTIKSTDYSTTAYLYNYTCSPPDTSTGCGTYHGELKFRIAFTPFAMTKFHCPCLFGTPDRVGEWVTIPLEEHREETVSAIKINLKTGEITQES